MYKGVVWSAFNNCTLINIVKEKQTQLSSYLWYLLYG